MGSHYIPVSGITIEKLKEIVEDAVAEGTVGGDVPGVTIDPAIFCDYHGYVPDPDVVAPFVPPSVFPEPGEQEIILIVSNDLPYKIYCRAYVNSGSAKYDIYDSSGVLVDTITNNTGLNYDFEQGQPLAHFTIRITPATAGSVITQFSRLTLSAYNSDWQIIAARFNTPDLTTLVAAFSGIKALEHVEFISTLNLLTNLSSTFNGAGIKKFVFPASLPEVTTFYRTFYEALDLIEVDFNNCMVPKATTVVQMFDGCANLRKAVINSKFNAVTTMQYFLRNTKRLHILTLDWGALPAIGTGSSSFQSVFYGSESLEELTIPYTESALNLNTPFQYMLSLKKLTLLGKFVTSGISSPALYCPKLEEIIFPEEYGQNSVAAAFTNSAPLKKITMPNVLLNSNFQTYYTLTSSANNIITIDGAMQHTTDNLSVNPQIDFRSMFLKVFNKPLLQVQSLRIGLSGGALEYVEIDWSNSFGAITGVAIYLYGNLSKTEIDRIFTALPSRSLSIDVRFNPGYATCDKTIAEAKGWTVI